MNNWTNDIHNKLSNRKGKAPEGLLDDIKLEMIRRGESPVIKRVRPLWYLRTAVAAVFIAAILGSGFYFLSEKEFDQPVRTSQNLQKETTPQPIIENIIADTTSVLQNNPLPALKAKYSNPVNRGILNYLTENKPTETKHSENTKTVTAENPTNSEKTEDPEQKQELNKTKEPEFTESDLYENSTGYNYIPKKEKKSKFSFGAFYAGTMTEKSSSMAGFLTMADPIGGHNKDMSQQAEIKDYTSSSRTKTKHYQPIKVGASFNYAINDKWGIQTGLTYSYLYSETNNVSNTSSYKSNQKLHYLGIPLNVTYSIWRNDKFNIYAAAGGQIDKMVSGRIQTQFKINGSDKNRVENKVTENKIHSSVNLSAGAEYIFAQNFSLYAEPGIIYYFDNKSPIKSVYNQKSVKFNINIGLRYTLNN